MDEEFKGVSQVAELNLDDLTPTEFRPVLEFWAEQVDGYVLLAPTKWGKAPVGMVAKNDMGHMIQPHVLWLPWATARNRMEAAMKFINDMRRETRVVIFARHDERKFWLRLSDYGVVRRRTVPGGIPGWFPDDACEIWIGA